MLWMNSECPGSFRNTSWLAAITSDASSQGTILAKSRADSLNLQHYQALLSIRMINRHSEDIFSEVGWLVRVMMGYVTCASHDAWQGIHDTIYHHHLVHFSRSLRVHCCSNGLLWLADTGHVTWILTPDWHTMLQSSPGHAACWHCSLQFRDVTGSLQQRKVITQSPTLIILSSPSPSPCPCPK